MDNLVTLPRQGAAPQQSRQRLIGTWPYGRWIDRGSSVWLFDRNYAPIWRMRPGKLVEAISGSRGDPWVDFVQQHWFYGIIPFRRTPESRALRRDLEEVLDEFWRGEVDGPIARRLIARIEKETACHREIWNARQARRAALSDGQIANLRAHATANAFKPGKPASGTPPATPIAECVESRPEQVEGAR